ncbi:MAG: hypothetical protein WAK42_22100, partial [Mycobacterium sp.]
MTATPPQNPQPIPALAMVAALVSSSPPLPQWWFMTANPNYSDRRGPSQPRSMGRGQAADPPPDHMDR